MDALFPPTTILPDWMKLLCQLCYQENKRVSSFLGLTRGGVNPLSETVCHLTVCRLLKSVVHFHGSSSEWSATGEAETGSGGDHPVDGPSSHSR